jgi:hypothetical protein
VASVPDPCHGVREAPRRLPPTRATAHHFVGRCSGLFLPLNSFIGQSDGALHHRRRCSVGPAPVDGRKTEEVAKPKKPPVAVGTTLISCAMLPRVEYCSAVVLAAGASIRAARGIPSCVVLGRASAIGPNVLANSSFTRADGRTSTKSGYFRARAASGGAGACLRRRLGQSCTRTSLAAIAAV